MSQRRSIKHKFLLLVLASVMAGLLAAVTPSIWIETDRYLQTKRRELQAIAQVFASSTASAAAERNAVAARQIMTSIGQIAGMQHAMIRTVEGRLLAQIGVAAQLDTDLKLHSNADMSFWQTLRSRTVQVSVPIIESGAEVGEFVLIGDASDLVDNLLRTLRLTTFGALLALGTGLIVAARLQRGIVAPLQKLTSAMEGIRKTHDYTAHVKVTSDDEVGQLVDGFNETLSEIRKRDRQLGQLAFYDPLTGLPNRSLFGQALDEALVRHERIGANSALLLLDLDHFKEVNDTLGHVAGDELLVKVARLIERAVGKQHFLARLGGDEFAIIVSGYENRTYIERIANEVIAALSTTIALERGDVTVQTSIGISLIPRDGDTANELVRNADLALYRAKENGRAGCSFFEPAMYNAVQSKAELARDLRKAVSQNIGLTVHYQPQVDLSTHHVTGFEALIRWKHPERGNIPPSEFIPVAESSRLICDLGLWVLRAAAKQAKSWLDAGELQRQVAVNLSAAQIWHTDVVREVASVLRETGLPAHLLCIELTESLLADHEGGRVRSVLNALKGLGVTLALDDFGTDYSSLGYLTQLPFDKLKIDRVFIKDIRDSARARELLKGIIALGRGLGMTVVAEGAEQADEIAMLQLFGCELAQGYVFCRPTEAGDALTFAHALEQQELVVSTPLKASERLRPEAA
jgi:diguanylate cyclase (GGDEF)-like protein